jgi:hypothetical protein
MSTPMIVASLRVPSSFQPCQSLLSWSYFPAHVGREIGRGFPNHFSPV